jgi:hypothetical protein
MPTITIQDHDVKKPMVVAEHSSQPVDNSSVVPGALPTGPAPAIPDWFKVGWRSISGIDKPPLAEGEERDKGVLEMFLSEQFYGAWYHNAALIVFVRN